MTSRRRPDPPVAGYSLLEGIGSALMIPPIYIPGTFSDLKTRAR